MRYLVLAVGRLRPPFSDDVGHYDKLLRRQARVEIVEVADDEALARRIPERAYVVLLDAAGTEHSAARSGRPWSATTTCSPSAR